MEKEDLRPLAWVVEEVCGKPEHEQYYTRAYFNWVHLIQMVDPRQGKFDEVKCEELVSKMSETQITSLELLQEWWEGQIQEQKVAEDIRSNILTAAMVPLMDDVSLATQPAGMAEAVKNIAQSETLPFDPKLEESSYHTALFMLWRCEFLVRDGMREYSLQSTRRWASIAGCNQRVAWLSFKDALAGSTNFLPSESQSMRKLIPPKKASLVICPWLGLKDKRAAQKDTEGWPHYLWDVKRKRTVEVRSLTAVGQRPRYVAVSHTWGRWRLREEPSVDVDGVPWKVPLNSKFDVRTMGQTLDSKIRFAEYVWIDLYCIPQETQDSELIRIRDSEIARQGEIFSNATSTIVWFNDVASWKGLEIAVLWFAATFLKQSRSQSEAGSPPQLEPWIKLFEREANITPTGLFKGYQYTGRQSLTSATPSGWFSSLWTLQEACLCPHIILAQQDWRIFAVGPNNLMITLDNLVAIVVGFQLHQEHLREAVFTENEFEQLPYMVVINHKSNPLAQNVIDRAQSLPPEEAFRLPDMPRAATELQFILDDTEMTQLLDIEPLTVLALANQRYCKHSRAQAIMSVLGATKWFNRHLADYGSGPREDNLVLGTFPLEFVKEIKSQLGVKFFTSVGSGSEVCPKEAFKRNAEQNTMEIQPIGSMLPFSSSRSRPKRALTNAYTKDSKGHPSALGWNILEDGSVEITSVAILASVSSDLAKDKTSQTHLSHLKARIIAHSCQNGWLVKDETLSTFLEGYSPHFNIYAVILTHGTMSRCYSGLILQEVVRPGGYGSPEVQKVLSKLQEYKPPTKLLVRVGTWALWDLKSTTEADLPSVKGVDWRVL
ncbi:hypothetical protein FNYG_12754 [Fusarium nygamai]|uniref:Heterokaryon incompatibility domain-containing protein n=1 Tax=Gibberella nygamai TaxID=42673 RepID=A0A2K0VV68_GIBNY|nr:hypothetical protein FNYG_12754 [Fusarium nygamai]